MLEEEAVGQVSAVPGRGAAARSSAPRRDIEDASEGEEEYDDAAQASPPKIRRIQKDAAPAKAKGKAAAAGGKKAAARPASRGTARAAGKTRTSGRRKEESASEEEEGSDEGEDSGSEGGGGKAGMIELDDEEAAALANLDLHDEVDDDESYEA
jgi:hypothetical protein